jgi:hypothetical protein
MQISGSDPSVNGFGILHKGAAPDNNIGSHRTRHIGERSSRLLVSHGAGCVMVAEIRQVLIIPM